MWKSDGKEFFFPKCLCTYIVSENMSKSQTASFLTFSFEREFSFLLLFQLSFCARTSAFETGREFCSETRVDLIFKGLSLSSLCWGKTILVARHLQMWNVKSSSKWIFIYFDAQYKLHLPTLYCAKCLLMYFTFEKSQIELGTKVDPLWYSFSLWSEYFDIVPAPREPFPSPGTGRNNSTYASSSSSSSFLSSSSTYASSSSAASSSSTTNVTINLTGSPRGIY